MIHVRGLGVLGAMKAFNGSECFHRAERYHCFQLCFASMVSVKWRKQSVLELIFV